MRHRVCCCDAGAKIDQGLAPGYINQDGNLDDLGASMSIANDKEISILPDLHRRYDGPERGIHRREAVPEVVKLLCSAARQPRRFL